MELPEHFQLDRSAMDIHTLTEKWSDRAYWLSRTPAERFEALELLRQIAYGYDPSTARLRRVFEVIELGIG